MSSSSSKTAAAVRRKPVESETKSRAILGYNLAHKELRMLRHPIAGAKGARRISGSQYEIITHIFFETYQARTETHWLIASQAQLALEAGGLPRPTVNRLMTDLEKRGIIQSVTRAGKTGLGHDIKKVDPDAPPVQWIGPGTGSGAQVKAYRLLPQNWKDAGPYVAPVVCIDETEPPEDDEEPGEVKAVAPAAAGEPVILPPGGKISVKMAESIQRVYFESQAREPIGFEWRASGGTLRIIQQGFVGNKGVNNATCQRTLTGAAPHVPRQSPRAKSQRFHEFIAPYPLKDDLAAAERMYLSRVKVADEKAAFACRDRYLASDRVARDVVMGPAKFIEQQSRNGWNGQWPRAAAKRNAPLPPSVPPTLTPEEAERINRETDELLAQDARKTRKSAGASP